MEFRRLGKTDLMASEVSAGCWAIGGPFVNLGVDGGWSDVPEEDAKAALTKAIEMGVNLFDTADVYGLGKSERMVGWLLRECQNTGRKREDLIVVSKTGLFRGCAPHGYHPLQMRHQLEMSLYNLGVDYIDIYFLHHLDFGEHNQYLQGAVDAIQQFKAAGLIRFIGLRGPHHFSFYRHSAKAFDADVRTFTDLAEMVHPDVITIRYNMFSASYNRPESDIFAWARDRDIGILIYKPLAQGLLIGAYSSDTPPRFEQGDSRRRKSWFRRSALAAIEDRLAYIKRHFGVSSIQELVHICIQYCLSRDMNACVLVGVENENHATEAFSASGRLSDGDIAFIRKVFTGLDQDIDGFGDLYFEPDLSLNT